MSEKLWTKVELGDFYGGFVKYGKDWDKVCDVIDRGTSRSADEVKNLYERHKTYLTQADVDVQAFISLVSIREKARLENDAMLSLISSSSSQEAYGNNEKNNEKNNEEDGSSSLNAKEKTPTKKSFKSPTTNKGNNGHRRSKLASPSNGGTIPNVVDQELVQYHRQRLENCLQSTRGIIWCMYEWFYSSVDASIHLQKSNTFQQYLNHTHVSVQRKRNMRKYQWASLKRQFGGRRRMSRAYFHMKILDIERMRQFVRCSQADSAYGKAFIRRNSIQHFPNYIPNVLSVGDRVTVRKQVVDRPQVRLMYRGEIAEVINNSNGGNSISGNADDASASWTSYKVLFDKEKNLKKPTQEILDIDVMPDSYGKTLYNILNRKNRHAEDYVNFIFDDEPTSLPTPEHNNNNASTDGVKETKQHEKDGLLTPTKTVPLLAFPTPHQNQNHRDIDRPLSLLLQRALSAISSIITMPMKRSLAYASMTTQHNFISAKNGNETIDNSSSANYNNNEGGDGSNSSSSTGEHVSKRIKTQQQQGSDQITGIRNADSSSKTKNDSTTTVGLGLGLGLKCKSIWHLDDLRCLVRISILVKVRSLLVKQLKNFNFRAERIIALRGSGCIDAEFKRQYLWVLSKLDWTSNLLAPLMVNLKNRKQASLPTKSLNNDPLDGKLDLESNDESKKHQGLPLDDTSLQLVARCNNIAFRIVKAKMHDEYTLTMTLPDLKQEIPLEDADKEVIYYNNKRKRKRKMSNSSVSIEKGEKDLKSNGINDSSSIDSLNAAAVGSSNNNSLKSGIVLRRERDKYIERLCMQNPYKLLIKCLSLLIQIKICAEYPLSNAEIANTLDRAVESLHPKYDSNAKAFRLLQETVDNIKYNMTMAVKK